jgi:hypothetical protein
MAEFEDSVRAAFEAELKGSEPAADLRRRVIQKAVSSQADVVPLPAAGRRLRPNRWMQVSAIAAAVALVALAGGLYARTAFTHPATAVHPTPSATSFGPMEAFGKLPPPALHGGQQVGLGGGGGGPVILQYSGPLYYGPANLSWAGKLPPLPTAAPVYRYLASDPAAEDALAARLGATLVSTAPQRTYRAPGFELTFGVTTVAGNSTEPSGVPLFTMAPTPTTPVPTRQGPMTQNAAKAAAATFLAKHGLTPSWPSKIWVAGYWSAGLEEAVYAVQYQRLIDLGNGTKAGLVDGLAQPLGLRVDVAAGTVLEVSGVPPLTAPTATYPLEPTSAAVQSALSAPPLDPLGLTPTPTVGLTDVQIVYSGVVSGQYVYLEPAYLFSGLFGQAGEQQQKVVLVPAVAGRDTQS